MHYFGLMKRVVSAILLGAGTLLGCRSDLSRGSARPPVAGTDVPVVNDAAVIAFWLGATDTIGSTERTRALDEFRHATQLVADYLDDTDVILLATLQDTVRVHLTGGATRSIMLSGLDYPYGFVFIEPGFAEEFHTGPIVDEDLEAALDDYFGFEPPDSLPLPRRIALAGFLAQRLPVHPGPWTARPGLAPVCTPSWSTATPLTKTCRIPTESWWGRSKVARSATVSGSKTTRSA